MREDRDFGTMELLQAAAERLSTEGWEVCSFDSPERGVRAFLCKEPNGRQKVLLKCAVYGRELVPEVTVCQAWTEFVDALTSRTDQDMEKSDALGEGQVGFVCYGRAESEGRSDVFRIGVKVLQAGGEVARATLMAILLKSQKQRALEVDSRTER